MKGNVTYIDESCEVLDQCNLRLLRAVDRQQQAGRRFFNYR